MFLCIPNASNESPEDKSRTMESASVVISLPLGERIYDMGTWENFRTFWQKPFAPLETDRYVYSLSSSMSFFFDNF